MEQTLLNYEGPAIVNGTEILHVEMRVYIDYGQELGGDLWSEYPIANLRGWEAEARFSFEPLFAMPWAAELQGVEIAIPGASRSGRATVELDYHHRQGYVVRFKGVGEPPVPGQ